MNIFEVGDSVTVVASADKLPKKARLYAGKTGIVKEVHLSGYITVQFPNGDCAAYFEDELEKTS